MLRQRRSGRCACRRSAITVMSIADLAFERWNCVDRLVPPMAVRSAVPTWLAVTPRSAIRWRSRTARTSGWARSASLRMSTVPGVSRTICSTWSASWLSVCCLFAQHADVDRRAAAAADERRLPTLARTCMPGMSGLHAGGRPASPRTPSARGCVFSHELHGDRAVAVAAAAARARRADGGREGVDLRQCRAAPARRAAIAALFAASDVPGRHLGVDRELAVVLVRRVLLADQVQRQRQDARPTSSDDGRRPRSAAGGRAPSPAGGGSVRARRSKPRSQAPAKPVSWPSSSCALSQREASIGHEREARPAARAGWPRRSSGRTRGTACRCCPHERDRHVDDHVGERDRRSPPCRSRCGRSARPRSGSRPGRGGG